MFHFWLNTFFVEPEHRCCETNGTCSSRTTPSGQEQNTSGPNSTAFKGPVPKSSQTELKNKSRDCERNQPHPPHGVFGSDGCSVGASHFYVTDHACSAATATPKVLDSGAVRVDGSSLSKDNNKKFNNPSSMGTISTQHQNNGHQQLKTVASSSAPKIINNTANNHKHQTHIHNNHQANQNDSDLGKSSSNFIASSSATSSSMTTSQVRSNGSIPSSSLGGGEIKEGYNGRGLHSQYSCVGCYMEQYEHSTTPPVCYRTVVLNKKQIDKANKDKQHKLFSAEFKVSREPQRFHLVSLKKIQKLLICINLYNINLHSIHITETILSFDHEACKFNLFVGKLKHTTLSTAGQSQAFYWLVFLFIYTYYCSAMMFSQKKFLNIQLCSVFRKSTNIGFGSQ